MLDRLVTTTAPDVVSVWFGDLSGSAYYRIAEDVTHYAASTMKLPLLVAAYRRAERGELDLDAEIPVHNSFRSAAADSERSGETFSLEQSDDQDDDTWDLLGGAAPLRRLVRHCIVHSGNLATNLVLEQVGLAEVAAVLAEAGCTRTRVGRGIGDFAARDAGLDNIVTATDLALVMAGVGARTLAAPATCSSVEDVLAAQEHRDMIPAGLPTGTYVANKTGWVEGVSHDVALIRPDGQPPCVMVICSTVDLPEADASRLAADIARAVWAEMRPVPGDVGQAR